MGSLDVASSRLRLYGVLERLADRVDATIVPPGQLAATLDTIDPRAYDLLYIQKDARPATVALAGRGAAAAVPIVYDLDDDIGCWPGMDESLMCSLATRVIVDTAGRRQVLNDLGVAVVDVIPCMVDLASVPRPLRPAEGPVEVVASFGNAVSVLDGVPYLDAVPVERTTFVVGPVGIEGSLGRHELVPYDRRIFVPTLGRAQACVLAHGSHGSALKDENRLVTAMSLGLPSIVNESAAYVRVLEEAGCEDLVCRTVDDVPDRVEALDDPGRRSTIGVRLRTHAWRAYAPDAIAAAVLALFHRAVERP